MKRPLPSVAAAVFLLLAGSAQGHGGVAVPYLTDPSPEQVVPRNGAAAPTTTAALGTYIFELDDVDPILEIRIVLTGISLFDDVESIQLRLGAPGANGPLGFDILSHAETPIGPDTIFVQAFWDDTAEDLGGDDIRDPEDQIALTDALGRFVAGDVYLEIRTRDFPGPDTAELRGQLARTPKPALILGNQGGRIGLGAAESLGDVPDVRSFESILLRDPDAGARRALDPTYLSSTNPPGMTPLPAGEISFDVVVDRLTGRNFSWWNGAGETVQFQKPLNDASLEIHGPLGGMLTLNGEAEAVAGLPLGSVAEDGSGLDARMDVFLLPGSASVSPPGVYVAAMRARIEPDDPDDQIWRSPIYRTIWGQNVSQDEIDRARAWLEAPEPGAAAQSLIACATLVLLTRRRIR